MAGVHMSCVIHACLPVNVVATMDCLFFFSASCGVLEMQCLVRVFACAPCHHLQGDPAIVWELLKGKTALEDTQSNEMCMGPLDRRLVVASSYCPVLLQCTGPSVT